MATIINYPGVLDDWRPEKNEIHALLRPHILCEYSAEDPEWIKLVDSEERRWRRHFFLSRVRKVFRGPIKSIKNVRGSYTQVWNLDMYPGNPLIDECRQTLAWGKHGFKVLGWVEKRIHLLLFLRLIEHLRPIRILEIGCGNGGMLMMLSLMYPEAEFNGMELTNAGVSAAETLQKKEGLPQGMLDFLPALPRDLTAFQRVQFRLGNAAELPFKDNSFDLIITSLALEQMNEVHNQVLHEVARVSARYAVMIEPFPDFNQSRVRQYYTRSRDYFSVSVDILTQYGLEPLVVHDDFPAKLTRGTGLVVVRCST